MKKCFQIIAMILAITLLGCGCTKTPTNEGEKLNTTINTTKKEDLENQGRLDALRPAAYGNVEGLNLKPGSHISIIGRYSGDSYWEQVEAGAEQAIDELNESLGYKGDDEITISFCAELPKKVRLRA